MRPTRIPIPARSTALKLDNRAGRVTWYSFRETTGAAGAVFQLIDGGDATGSLVMSISLLAGESTREWVGLDGCPYAGGLFLNMVSGTIEGAVLAVDETEWVDLRELMAVAILARA